MVSVCLPTDALLQHLLSYLGFSYLGGGVSSHCRPSWVLLSALLQLRSRHSLVTADGDCRHEIKRCFTPWKESHGQPAAAAAKLLQSCPTLCDLVDGSPPDSAVPGIPQARTLEWVAISFSNARKWKVKVTSLSRVRLLATPWTAAYQAPPPMGFSRPRVLEWGAVAFSNDQPRLHIKKQRHYFANKSPSS